MPPPPLLLPPPPLGAIGVSESSQRQQHLHRSSSSSSSRNGLSPSILIVTGLIAFVFVTSASIHLLLRFLSRRSRHPHRSLSTSTSFSIHPPPPPQDPSQKPLAESLPLFSLASALAAVPKSSPDCAVCLSKFDPNDQLRLLPACHHAFHASCIDTWLRATPSCPLCRSSVLPLPLPPPNSIPNPNTPRSERSDSFRLEIGSVSRRREEAAAAAQQQTGRSYSLGSSFEYVVEEEIEAVVAAVAAHVRRSSKESAPEGLAPGEEVAGMVGGSGASWLKEYLDRLAMPASSSFSTMGFSGRWSRRSDGVAAVAAGGGGDGGSWDLEGNGGGEDLAVYYSIYRWLVGV